MSSWTLWEPRLNSIAAHARLWAGDADATHPKNRSSSMTSVTGSPAGNHVPAYTCASWSVTIVLPSIVALRVRASTVSRTVPRARRQGLVLCVPTILAPARPGVLSSRAIVGYVHQWGVRHSRTYKRSHARQSHRAIARTSVTLRVRASQHTRGSLPCFLRGALCYPQGRPRIPGGHEPLALVWVAPAHMAGAGLLYHLHLDTAMRVPNASHIDFEELRQVEVLWTTP